MNRPEDGTRWQQIESLFHQVLEHPIRQRQIYLREQCGADETLLKEVWSLVDAFESSTEFLESFGESEQAILAEVVDGLQIEGNGHNEDPTIRQQAEGDSAIPLAGAPLLQSVEEVFDHGSAVRTNKILKIASSGLSLAEIKTAIQTARPDFDVIDEIGRGGTGIVVRVRDHRLQRELAVKFLHRNLGAALGRGLVDQSELLVREGRAAAAVSSDHIVRVYEIAAAEAGFPFLVLEWIAGPSLRQLLNVHETLPPQKAAEIVRQIGIGLGAAHRKGVIHGDVKPANVLLEPVTEKNLNPTAELPDWKSSFEIAQWRVKVTDFGLAQDTKVDDEISDNASLEAIPQKGVPVRFAGTPAYASPERLLEGVVGDTRSDVWSAGATLYRMLTGVAPYRGAPHAIARQMQKFELTSPRALDPNIPRDLDSICMKALSRNPTQRYADGNEFAADLQRYLLGHTIIARPVSTWRRCGRWMLRNPRVATLSIALGLTILALVVGSLVAAAIMSHQNRQILVQTRASDFARLQRIIDASPSVLPLALDSQELNQDFARPFLLQVVDDTRHKYQARVNAAVALAALGDGHNDFLVEAVRIAPLQPEQPEFSARVTG